MQTGKFFTSACHRTQKTFYKSLISFFPLDLKSSFHICLQAIGVHIYKKSTMTTVDIV